MVDRGRDRTASSNTPPISSSRPSRPLAMMLTSKVRSSRSRGLNQVIRTCAPWPGLSPAEPGAGPRRRSAACAVRRARRPSARRGAPGRPAYAQRQRHDDDVVERPDDRDELGDQIDWAGHPDPGEDNGDLCSAWDARILAQSAHRGHAVGDERGEVPQQCPVGAGGPVRAGRPSSRRADPSRCPARSANHARAPPQAAFAPPRRRFRPDPSDHPPPRWAQARCLAS